MKRIFALLLAAAIIASGCSMKKKETEPKIPADTTAINIQLGGEPDTLDPAFAVSPEEESYIIHLLEGLTKLSDRLEAEPAAAASWERTDSDTGVITYTFKMNPNAKWSDERSVKAEDFIYSWKRTLNPATKSPVAYKLYPIKGAKAVNQDGAEADTLGVRVGEQGELIVDLEGECNDFLQRLAGSAWMPLRESVVVNNQDNWFYDGKRYLTNGAYCMESWERDQQIVLSKSASYWNKDAVKAARLNFILRDDREALLKALRDGSVQLATDLPQLELEAAAVDLGRNVTLGTYALVFNSKSEALKDPKVRQALSMALDRQKLTEQMRDNSVPATALVPEGAVVDGVDLRKKGGTLVSKAANIEKSKRLLKEAGYDEGKNFPTLKYVINDEGTHKRMAEYVAEMWKPLGVNVEIVELPWDDYLSYRKNGKFDVTRISVFSDELYPSAFFDSWLSDSTVNYAAYNSNAYDGLIDMSYGREPRKLPEADKTEDEKATDKTEDKKAADKTEDEKTAEGEADTATEIPKKSPVDCLNEAEALLVRDDAVIVPISWYTNVYLTSDNGLKGFRAYPTGVMYFGGATYKKTGDSRQKVTA